MPATPQVMLSQIAAWLPALDDAAHTATGLHSPHTALGSPPRDRRRYPP